MGGAPFFQMNPKMPHQFYIGIDIGGTNTRIAAVDSNSNILLKKQFRTFEFPSGSEFLSQVSFTINDILGEINFELAGIGIGSPCGNYHTGIIEAPVNIKWDRPLNIKKVLSQIYGVEVNVTNDANLAALGEKAAGKAKELDNFISITIGTGLGAGIFVDGHLLQGNIGFAGEIGHLTVDPGGRHCKCGRRGCLETFVSASGIVRTYLKELSNQTLSSNLIQQKIENISAERISSDAKSGDQMAINALKITGEVLGKALANMAIAYAPEAIFLSGGPVGAGDLLLEPTKKSFCQNLIKNLEGKIQIDYSYDQSNELALVGAAYLVRNDHQLVMENTL